ncbi:MAG TPA: hypothetical protein VMU41_07780 [Candidatus Binataceae bacterium]|nr:hypothetical protein [Candidatus Binataceae bacterium]
MDQEPRPRLFAGWLELVEGVAPLLLIAPHGGRAGPAARATLHPKVNDLETAPITRELAKRTGASALINFAMDRNELDCNRLAQVAARAPWLLDLIADRVAAIVERHGRATVLLIHGWNVIEPRVDFGLGLRERAGRLHPPAGAHVSAADAFIHGPVAALCRSLHNAGITPSFGLRYPGGGKENLLQAFTPRHAASELNSLQRLASMAERGLIDALQLEMSVAVRLAGELRNRNLDTLSAIFCGSAPYPELAAANHVPAPITIVRSAPAPRSGPKPQSAVSQTPPTRVGLEFFDPVTGLGAMASFDFGANAAGGRIMVLFDGFRAALFTGEGKPARDGTRIRLGPLELDADPTHGRLSFCGTAVVVNDGAAYLSVERALAEGHLDHAMELSATLDFPSTDDADPDLLAAHHARVVAGDVAEDYRAVPAAAYGRLRGSIVIEGQRRELNAIARLGFSFTGLSPQKFLTRRMFWACFPGEPLTGLEARLLTFGEAPAHRSCSLLNDSGWHQAELATLIIETPTTGACPDQLAASFIDQRDGSRHQLDGVARNYMTLSRPGFGNARIYTSLGFATYQLSNLQGAGMFEYSRITEASDAASADPDSDND